MPQPPRSDDHRKQPTKEFDWSDTGLKSSQQSHLPSENPSADISFASLSTTSFQILVERFKDIENAKLLLYRVLDLVENPTPGHPPVRRWRLNEETGQPLKPMEPLASRIEKLRQLERNWISTWVKASKSSKIRALPRAPPRSRKVASTHTTQGNVADWDDEIQGESIPRDRETFVAPPSRKGKTPSKFEPDADDEDIEEVGNTLVAAQDDKLQRFLAFEQKYEASSAEAERLRGDKYCS